MTRGRSIELRGNYKSKGRQLAKNSALPAQQTINCSAAQGSEEMSSPPGGAQRRCPFQSRSGKAMSQTFLQIAGALTLSPIGTPERLLPLRRVQAGELRNVYHSSPSRCSDASLLRAALRSYNRSFAHSAQPSIAEARATSASQIAAASARRFSSLPCLETSCTFTSYTFSFL